MLDLFIKAKVLAIFTIVIITISGCKKFVDVQAPITNLNGDNVFVSDATAISAVTGIYTLLSQGQSGLTEYNGNAASISVRCGLSSDELTLYSGVADLNKLSYFKNQLVSNNSLNVGSEFWPSTYSFIYKCNDILEGLGRSSKLTSEIRNQLEGETKFLRAFFYFYLVNLYGDAPLIRSTDYKENNNLRRSPKSEIYQQIINDLKDAQILLGENYVDGNLKKYSQGNEQRLRPNKYAASALLARTYLYIKDYVNAEALATSVISNTSFYKLDSLNGVFLKSSKEAIWQLQPISNRRNTEDAFLFILPNSGPNDNNHSVHVSNKLISSFDSTDLRKIAWFNQVTTGGIRYYFPFKYKNISANLTEYLVVLRLAEVYLIRAEARVQINSINNAISDINIVRNRAGLNSVITSNVDSLRTIVLHERQDELFTEWGHRWLDLKRTNSIDTVMSKVTPTKAPNAQWQSYQQWYPVPYSDILKNSNLDQNSGY